jgi:sec-independent protein translocase protein TatC
LFLPLGDNNLLQFLNPLDPLWFILKIDLFVGFILSIPIAILLAGQFIAPAVPHHSGQVLAVVIFAVVILASLGGIYAYLFVIPIVLNFLQTLPVPDVVIQLSAMEYLHFFISMLFMHIITFQTPVVVTLLIVFGVTSSAYIASIRRYVYVSILSIVAIVSPTTDVLTFLALVTPTLLMFEGGLVLGYWLSKRDAADVMNQ